MRSLLVGSALAVVSASSAAAATCAKTRGAASSSASYDFVVVGGGPAGIIAATRLAQNKKPGQSVLLVSRGPGPTTDTGAVGGTLVGWDDDSSSSLTPVDVPGLSTALTAYNTTTVGDDGEEAEKDLFSAYLCDDVSGSSAACVFGGGATFNYMVFAHPPDQDFDDKWPVGWKWADVADAADRVWSLNPGTSVPSQDGQLYDQGMYETVAKYLNAQGWAAVDQVAERNSKTKVYSHPHWDIGHDAVRVGPVRTYLPLAEAEDNFSYQLHSTVRRVLRDGAKITGVEYSDDTTGAVRNITLNEGGKVILAAGPWNTPRILFNSGIGPAEQIRTVADGTTGIPVPPEADWIELPVGQAIKDHPIFSWYVQTSEGNNWTAFNTTGVVNGTDTASIAQYEQQRSGVLAQGYHRLVFWTSNIATSDNVTRYYQGSVSPQGADLFLVKGYLTHGATSSGAMGIRADGSVAYTEAPYLRTEGDREGAALFVEELLGGMASHEGWALARGTTNASDVLATYTQGNHYVGTAVLGTDDKTSVVSADDLHVWGTDNLFVVDSSIHADLPTGNTQAITMVVAEKAIEKILQADVATSSY